MTWPTEADCPKFYGPKGENQTSIVLPYPMRIAWAPGTTVFKMTCHEKVADPMKRIFTKLMDEYGKPTLRELGIDLFGGCLNVRLKRGSKTSWSIHSWGCAVDLDPDRNALRETSRTARFARPEYLPMWKIIEGEGAVSLGRTVGWDYMHWQFARLR
jgi:hypothetical protein